MQLIFWVEYSLLSMSALAAGQATPLAELQSFSSASSSLVEIELQKSMGGMYGEAIRKYTKADYGGAEKDFQDCYSVWQQARPVLSSPGAFEKMRLGCEAYLEKLRTLQKLEALHGGVKTLASKLTLDQFKVEGAELSVVLERLRTRTGLIMRGTPPNFVTALPDEMARQKVTLDLHDLTILQALEIICSMTGTKMQFERYAVVFLPRETVSTVGK